MTYVIMQIPTKRPNDPACFPAWEKPDLNGTLVDLRLFPAHYNGACSRTDLVFRPEPLERDGINPAILVVAARSSPPGWALRKADGWYSVDVKEN